MKSTFITVVLTAMPALLAAQASGTSNGEVQGKINVPSTYSAESRTKIEAAFAAAHTKNLPDQILRDRLTEGQATNAAEADVVASIEKLESQLDETQQSLVQAGRQNPTADEITAAATAMGRGLTAAQISALAKDAPADRSLAVAFNTLNKLAVRGQPIDQALASVQAKLQAKESDDAIATLAGDPASPAAAPAVPAVPAVPSPAAVTNPVTATKDSAAAAKPDAGAKPAADSAKAAPPKKPAADSGKVTGKPPVGKP